MSIIRKQDTDGEKTSNLGVGEFGFDANTDSYDKNRVYIGTLEANDVKLATLSDAIAHNRDSINNTIAYGMVAAEKSKNNYFIDVNDGGICTVDPASSKFFELDSNGNMLGECIHILGTDGDELNTFSCESGLGVITLRNTEVDDTSVYGLKLNSVSNVGVVSNINDNYPTECTRQGDMLIIDDVDVELSPDPDFDNGIYTWSTSTPVTSVNYDSDNKMLVVRSDGEDSTYFPAIAVLQSLSGDMPGKYEITVSYNSGDAGGIKIYCGDSDVIVDTDNDNEEATVTKVVSSASVYLEFKTVGNTDKYAEISYMSIKRVEPLFLIRNTSDTSSSILSNYSPDTLNYSPKIFTETKNAVREDFVFLEIFEEDVIDKDFVHVFGNVSFEGSYCGSFPTLETPTFDGYDTYSLPSVNADTNVIGKGVRWSSISDDDRLRIVSDKRNNITISDNGRYIQTKFRLRTVSGNGSSWSNVEYSTGTNLSYNYAYGYNGRIMSQGSKTTPYYEADLYGVDTGSYSIHSSNSKLLGSFSPKYGTEIDTVAVPIALVQRRNIGVYHVKYNPHGTAKYCYINDDGTFSMIEWYELGSNSYPENSLNNISKSAMFSPDHISCINDDGSVIGNLNSNDSSLTRTGSVKSTVCGRPDGMFYDGVYDCDITDLRKYATDIDFERVMDDYHTKVRNGSVRGKEKAIVVNDYTSIDSINERYTDAYGRLNTGTYTESDYTYNNYGTACSILGDPRKLSDRVSIVTVSGDGLSYDVFKGMYIKADEEYYRSLSDRGLITVDPDTEDYTDITNWISLGSDGTIGSMPINLSNGTECMYDFILDDVNKSYNGFSTKVSGHASYRGYFKVCKKIYNNITAYYQVVYEVLAILPDGEVRKLTFDANYGNAITGDYDIYWTRNYDNSISFGISGVDEKDWDLIKILVFYKTKVSTAIPTKNSKVISYSNIAMTECSSFKDSFPRNNIVYPLLGKVNTSTINGNYGIALYNLGFDANRIIDPTYGIPFTNTFFSYMVNFNLLENASSPTLKYIHYLSENNGVLQLVLLFKELAFTNGSWGEDVLIPVTDYVDLIADTNGTYVMFGQKSIELPYYFKGD